LLHPPQQAPLRSGFKRSVACAGPYLRASC
jgi:hypothetical protein